MSTHNEPDVQEGEYTIRTVANNLATVVSAEIDVQITTAKAYPRSLDAFKKRSLSLATQSVEVAESCEYGLPRGGKVITGPSVRFAEIVAHSYGNLRVGKRVITRDGRSVTAQGICHDLETNVCITVEVTRSTLQHEYKNGVKTGRMVQMNEDLQVLAGNAAASVAFRNAVFAVVPKASWNDVYQQTRVVAKGDAATLSDRRQKAVQFFRDKGVKDEQILAVLQVKSMEEIDLDKLSILSSFKAALKNNEASLESLFPKPTPKDQAKAAEKATEDKLKKTGNGVKSTLDKLKKNLKSDPPAAGEEGMP